MEAGWNRMNGLSSFIKNQMLRYISSRSYYHADISGVQAFS